MIESVHSKSLWVDKTLGSLSLREKIGQMLIPFVAEDAKLDEIGHLVDEYGVGGLRISGKGLKDQRKKIVRGQSISKIPLLMPGNLETGAGHIVQECTSFTSQMGLGATGDEKLASRMGEAIAIEGRAVGYNMYLGPVVDLTCTPHCPKNIRCLGSDPLEVGKLAVAVIKTVQANGMASSPKHFPGNGFGANDTHLTTQVNPLSHDEWLLKSGAVFKAVIDAGAYTVMSSHIALPSWDPDAGDSTFPRPASLSRPLLVDLLRQELGFDGLVVTDAINMGGMALHAPYFEMVLQAVNAGNDIMLFVRRIPEVIDYLEKAILDKRLQEERIEDAVRRILTLKAKLNLHDGERVCSEAEAKEIISNSPYGEDAAEMAERSLCLIRDTKKVFPVNIKPGMRIASVCITNQTGEFNLSVFENRLKQHACEITSFTAPMDVFELYDQVEKGDFDLLIVGLYYPPSYGWNCERAHGPASRGLMGGWMVANPDVSCIYISFANPNHLHEFPFMDPYLCAWGGAHAMQEAAADAIVGKISITGKSPIALEGFFQIGNGVQINI